VRNINIQAKQAVNKSELVHGAAGGAKQVPAAGGGSHSIPSVVVSASFCNSIISVTRRRRRLWRGPNPSFLLENISYATLSLYSIRAYEVFRIRTDS
jgi:hypothetical protein